MAGVNSEPLEPTQSASLLEEPKGPLRPAPPCRALADAATCTVHSRAYDGVGCLIHSVVEKRSPSYQSVRVLYLIPPSLDLKMQLAAETTMLSVWPWKKTPKKPCYLLLCHAVFQRTHPTTQWIQGHHGQSTQRKPENRTGASALMLEDEQVL